MAPVIKPLHTLTGNLLWERTLNFETWAPGQTQRAQTESFQAGGKGINVSRMLTRLGVPTQALCFAGGSTGAECLAWMHARGIPHRAFASTATTRSGIVIRSNTRPETTFLGPDVSPEATAWAACAAYLDAQPDGQILALCGSFPGWTDDDATPLRTALARWARRGMLVADTYGAPLAWALQQPLALAKINRDEFSALAATAPASLSVALPVALAKTQTAAWIVTDGSGPIWLAERDSPEARRLEPPRISAPSPTGSGDVLLACLLHAHYHRQLPWSAALAWALPYATANAMHPGIAEFDLNNLPASWSVTQ